MVTKEKKETILTIDTRGISDQRDIFVDSDNEDSDETYLDNLGKAVQSK